MRITLLAISLIAATAHADWRQDRQQQQDAIAAQRAAEVAAATETPDIIYPTTHQGIFVTQDVLDKYSKDFDTIIVVNKAPDVQRLAIYRFGQKLPNTIVKTITAKDANGKFYKKQETVERWKVSTGTEQWTCDSSKDADGVVIGKRAVWTGTPTGFYVSSGPDIDHHSKAFHDSWMKYAFWFDPIVGLATHLGEESQFFGVMRRSHGCVRMTEKDAKDIFTMSLLSGGPIDLNSPDLQGQCPTPKLKTGVELQNCLADAAARTKEYAKEVTAMAAQGAQERGFDGSPLPYSRMPLVPDLKRDGSPRLDPKTGQPRMIPGYRTLVIVECVGRDQTTDCSLQAGIRGAPPICTEELQKQDRNFFDSVGDFFSGKNHSFNQQDPNGSNSGNNNSGSNGGHQHHDIFKIFKRN